MYTRRKFGFELKIRALEKQDVVEIGIWAYSAYIENITDLDPELSQVMLDLCTMELGPEFARSYEMLIKIANDLIAGKIMDLNSEEYRG